MELISGYHLHFTLQEIRAQINQATESPSEKDDELPQSKKLKLDVGDGKCDHKVVSVEYGASLCDVHRKDSSNGAGPC